MISIPARAVISISAVLIDMFTLLEETVGAWVVLVNIILLISAITHAARALRDLWRENVIVLCIYNLRNAFASSVINVLHLRSGMSTYRMLFNTLDNQ